MLRINFRKFPGNEVPRLACFVGNSNRFSSTRGARSPKFAWPAGMVAPEDDFSETPEYPQIDPETHQWNFHKRERRQKALDWHKSIRDQPNPEAKTMHLNLPRKFGYAVNCLNEDFFDYDSLDFYRFVTRTKLVSGDGLPEAYSGAQLVEKAKYFAEKVKEPLLDALRFEMDGHTRTFEGDLKTKKRDADLIKSQAIVNQVNRVVLAALGEEVDHLKNCQVDYSPNIEAFWFSGGHPISQKGLAIRKGSMEAPLKHKRYMGEEGDPVERNLQFKSSALLQIRTKNPLQNYEDFRSKLCNKSEDVVNQFPYSHQTYRIYNAYKYASMIPGTWTGDGYDNSFLSFHPRHHLLHHSRIDNKYWNEDNENALASQATLVSFARLLSQTLYHGFDQFCSLPYPFSTQTVITNGVNYSFFAYQLNTLQLSQMYLEKNDKQNLCWGTKSMKIFDEKDPKSLNAETVETLLKFYLTKTTAIPKAQAKPYLTEPLNQFSDEIQREVIFYNYRDMVSQRWYAHDALLSRQMPEIYDWERIYKVKHPQRHMEPRRRFFELPSGFKGSKPYDEPYKLKNPRKVTRRLGVMREEVAARKEKERLEASKAAEKAKYMEYPVEE